jgi:hypothetical protein
MLLEIDTVRADIDEATELFKASVLPQLAEQEGFEGVLVFTTPEGKGMIVTFWETEEAAVRAAGFGTDVLERYVALFKAPPGRDHYRVALAQLPVGVG